MSRLAAFPALVPTVVSVTGKSWLQSSVDVAIAGLGWVGVGCKGPAELRVWAPPRVAITTHDALVPDYARELERPGFGAALMDATSKAKASSSKGPGGKKGSTGGGGGRSKTAGGSRKAALPIE